nr:MAG TPA: hypothetical protein [Caudoviricetes sp.]
MKIRVLKGYLSHKDGMYKKGEVVEVSATIAKSLLESEKFEAVEDVAPVAKAPAKATAKRDAVDTKADDEMVLPEVDAKAVVAK